MGDVQRKSLKLVHFYIIAEHKFIENPSVLCKLHINSELCWSTPYRVHGGKIITPLTLNPIHW